jgi:hypothetical protein
LDYSKCLGISASAFASPENSMNTEDELGSAMNYTTFVKIIGKGKIEKFKRIKDFLSGEYEDFFTLFHMWEYFQSIWEQDTFSDSTDGKIQNENKFLTSNGNDLDIPTGTQIFGLKRDEVTGSWGKLHNEELHGLYSSPSIIRVIKARRIRWTGNVARMVEVRGAYNILVERPEGRRPLGRPRRRWEDNIKMDRREIRFGDVDWIHLAQDRDRWRAVVNTVMNLRVP